MTEYSSDVHWFFYPLLFWWVECPEVRAERIEPLEPDRAPEGPGEASPPAGEIETACVGVEPGSASGGGP